MAQAQEAAEETTREAAFVAEFLRWRAALPHAAISHIDTVHDRVLLALGEDAPLGEDNTSWGGRVLAATPPNVLVRRPAERRFFIEDGEGLLAWVDGLQLPAHNAGDDEDSFLTAADGNGTLRPVRAEFGIVGSEHGLCVCGPAAAGRAMRASLLGFTTFMRETLEWQDADACAARLFVDVWSRPVVDWPSSHHPEICAFGLVLDHPGTVPTHMFYNIVAFTAACAAVAQSNGIVLLGK